MSTSLRGFISGLLAISLLSVAFITPAAAQKKSRLRDATERSGEAAQTFTEIMNVKDKAIPQELLDKAEAIAVFPGVIKAAFIFGGRGGKGRSEERRVGEG